ncbi:hypothetical protein [Amycolatopsis sp. lyj-108]|uniref:hypothetical protein n=1 Tax=Amycolatopsis sp. lyj-108 TaxID=2789286 RepID=UPI0039791010
MNHDFTELLAQLRAATTDSLADQAEQITQGAQELGLRVIPARLDPDRVVEIDSATLSAEQVVAIAASVDAALLYLSRVLVTQDAVDTALEDLDAGAERTRVSKALFRIVGWTSRVEVGFAHAGVLHVWEVTASWHDALDELTTPARSSRWDPEPRVSDDAEDEKLMELARQVAASPEFRRARYALRRSVAEQLPVLAELRKDADNGPWMISSVISAADELVRERAAERAELLQARRDDLVAELATHPDYATIRTAEARLKFVQTWIRDTHTAGLPMETWWLKELVALTAQARKTSGALQLTL